eukprot:Plantae.Rhodophyta-Rhodochaete_pulchella.ctg15844.p3 GENE.Plantae.Rhodophyta-Rhodochaete_pulchella.ctg15844~~Plantae.Rhodophyta-Rhodochaete_pulchella.ctg15844.p3  ORF type:complete len:251 (-),score=53.95 Plantae.Rhodophyta-Rhodochaete_pulchella.ctg15844:1911-2663(-)
MTLHESGVGMVEDESDGPQNEADDKAVKTLTPEELEEFQAAQRRRGVVYLSRLPPFMTPGQVRTTLSKIGEVDRVFLKPEDPEARKKRIRAGGRRKTSFSCGWVEFVRKSAAKSAAELLNNQPMGGKKRSAFHDDLWNIKYLKGFLWNDLTEQMTYERRVRELRIKSEEAQARRERDFYLEKVGQAKGLEEMRERKAKKRVAEGDKAPAEMKVVRQFDQRKARKLANDDAPKPELSDQLLGLVFGQNERN